MRLKQVSRLFFGLVSAVLLLNLGLLVVVRGAQDRIEQAVRRGEAAHAEVDDLRVPFMDRTGVVSSFTNLGQEGFIRLSAHAYTTPDDVRAMATTGVPTLAQWVGDDIHERTARCAKNFPWT